VLGGASAVTYHAERRLRARQAGAVPITESDVQAWGAAAGSPARSTSGRWSVSVAAGTDVPVVARSVLCVLAVCPLPRRAPEVSPLEAVVACQAVLGRSRWGILRPLERDCTSGWPAIRATAGRAGQGGTCWPLPTMVIPPGETKRPRARSCCLSTPTWTPPGTTAFSSTMACLITARGPIRA
jgi:hypothetical protein